MRYGTMLKAIIPLALLAAACAPSPSDQSANEVGWPGEADVSDNAADASMPPPPAADPEAVPAPDPEPLIGETVALAEWRKADNRATCAPLALASDGGAGGTLRRANFGGGWGIAFDVPNVRSAYGFAGAGALDQDRLPQADRAALLEEQWPYHRRWGAGANLPAGSFAGYGLVGAERYRQAQPGGEGEHSLAYLRIPGQACLYNVWSRVSRAHLEALLDGLRIVEP